VSEGCYPIERLGEIAELAADDPRRGHLANCPRCRARLAAYERFLSQEDPPKGLDLASAEARLASVLQAEIGAGATPAAGPVARADDAVVRPEWWRWSGMRWAAALAAMLAVAVGLTVFTDRSDDWLREPVLRGDEDAAAEAFAPTAETLDGGGVLLTWQAVPEAECYRVLLFGADLLEVARWETGVETELSLGPNELAKAVYWRVVALRGGDTLQQAAVLKLGVR